MSAHMSSILCSPRHEPDIRVISSAYSIKPAEAYYAALKKVFSDAGYRDNLVERMTLAQCNADMEMQTYYHRVLNLTS